MISTCPAPTTPKPSLSRQALIEQRRQGSVVWQVIHLLGSLQLALVLLAVIAIACAVATFYESSFSAAIAQHYIYEAPWFLAWLGLLCVNLFAVTLTRWPWEKKHLGFVLTHYSIIVLLIGAVIGSRWGFEGNVTLHKERPPVTRVTTSRSILQINDPFSPTFLLRPFDAAVTRPRPDRPIHFPVPGTNWKIEALDEAKHLVREPVLRPAEHGRPGLIVELSSVTAGQALRWALHPGEGGSTRQSLGGMAEVVLLGELPALQQDTLRENRMVWAKYAPVRHGDETQVEISLSADGELLRIAPVQGAAATYRLAEVLGKELNVGPDTLVTVRQYWPHFELRDGQPVSVSEEPKNPAVLVSIEEKQTRAGTESSGANLQAQLAVSDDGQGARVRFLRAGSLENETLLPQGQTVATGWNDWQMRLVDVGRSTALAEEIRPGRPGVRSEETGVPGFLARLRTAEAEGEPVWVESGRMTTLTAGNRTLRIGYGLQTQPLPFAIHLVNFEVPRFEGTSTPANFIATVEFRDVKTGETRQDVARMNKPAIWPAGLAPVLTGWNYKFSQAEWNPQDLNETTLQVLHDPGWMLKWLGSLGICLGIGLMFYWKPKS